MYGDLCALHVNTLIMFNFAHLTVSADRTDLEQLGVKPQSMLSIISKYRENGGSRALDYRVEKFCQYVGSSFYSYLFDAPESSSGPSTFK